MPSEPSWAEMFAWLHSHLPPNNQHILQSLTNGAAFLLLISSLRPAAFPVHQIILTPSSKEELHANLTLLSAAIHQLKVASTIKVHLRASQIGRLAEGQRTEGLKLLSCLYKAFGKEGRMPKQECKLEGEKESTVQEEPNEQRSAEQVKKECKEEVTDEQLQQLHQLREKLNQIKAIVKGKKPREIKMQSIRCILKKQPIKQSVHKKYTPKVITGFTNFLAEEIQSFIDKKTGQTFKKIPQEINQIQISRQVFRQIDNLKRNKLVMLEQLSLFKNVGFFTEQILKNISKHLQLSKEELEIIDNFSLINGSFESFAYLFMGKKSTAHAHRKYNIQESNQDTQLARKDLKDYCQRFYRSSLLAKRILLSVNTLMRSKLILCRMLSNIELLPSYKFSREEFFSSCFECYEINKHPEGGAVKKEHSEEKQKENNNQLPSRRYQTDQQSSKICQNDHSVPINFLKGTEEDNFSTEEVVSTKRKPTPLYWSQHRRVLIAFQARHVYNKKPDFQDVQSFHKFITSTAHQRLQFDGGFLFPGNKNRMAFDYLKAILQSDKYPHLMALFIQEKATNNELRLGEFVRIMLELKHHSIVKEFMEIYDVIVGEVRMTSFSSLQKPSDRAAIVECIAKKVEKGVGRISDYFVNTYDMEDDTAEVQRLVKVTVYCFLAELHGFSQNEYYCDAFDFPAVDLKTTSKCTQQRIGSINIT